MVLSESQVVGIVIFSTAYHVMYSIVINSVVKFITRGKWYCQKGKVVGDKKRLDFFVGFLFVAPLPFCWA